ncbi:MAG: transcriptional regulator [Sulfobacillus thermosulfidooxidans]|uniref:winged helix-turn-helix transcriptional regulator n=1 Tax=Sulfobacillus TaxID=28033 RepID=UPI000CD2DF4D|nr:helix-turn-helix domain-containing protein [Sulfobacillus sp. hq2]POB10459.1 transcriptional regulator [Sulfobacillus sp. hq2]PSR36697.1 MAG: transcriptional regulator [Sulfobacillus thermosulfidooxidans]
MSSSLHGSNALCPVARGAALVGDLYILLIVRDLAEGSKRFGELEESLGVTARTLTARLRMLETEQIVERVVYPEIPPRVEYSLTIKGRDLLPVIEALRQFGEKWTHE